MTHTNLGPRPLPARRRISHVWLLAAATLAVALERRELSANRATLHAAAAARAAGLAHARADYRSGQRQQPTYSRLFHDPRLDLGVRLPDPEGKHGVSARQELSPPRRDRAHRARGRCRQQCPGVLVLGPPGAPPALYYCADDRYATSSARQIIPVDPNWLIEALGVVTFDPSWRHLGPSSLGGGRIEIRSEQPASESLDPLKRIVVLDELRGIVLEQHLYNSSNQRIATSKLSKHQHDPTTGVTMPRRVEIEWPATKFSLTIDLTDLQINQVGGDPRQLFTRPQYPGYQDIDLAGPDVGPAMPGGGIPGQPTPAFPAAAPSGLPAAPTASPTAPPAAWQPNPAYQVSPQPTLAPPQAAAGAPAYALPAQGPPPSAGSSYATPNYSPPGAYSPPGSPPARAAQAPPAYSAPRSPSY